MNLQKRIAFIMNNNFPASVKRKHMIYLIQHLDYSEDANELEQAYDQICEAIEQLDNEIYSLNQAHEFKSRKYDKGADGSMITDLYMKATHGWFPIEPLTVTELDRTLEFFLTYNILSMQQVQDIRAKAAAYLR